MREVLNKLEIIEKQVNDLLERHRSLTDENSKLKKENIQLINDLNRLKEENAAFEVQLTTALADVKAGQSADAERKKIRKELGQYIKTIDKCILLMRDA